MPAGNAEPGGWADYSGDFDPDFELEDLSHRALVVALQEVAVQSHLLFRCYLLAVAQAFGEDKATASAPGVFTGLAGLTAQRRATGDSLLTPSPSATPSPHARPPRSAWPSSAPAPRSSSRPAAPCGYELVVACWQPQRDSNPCLDLERVVS